MTWKKKTKHLQKNERQAKIKNGIVTNLQLRLGHNQSLRKEILLDLPGLALIARYGEGQVAGPTVFYHFKTYFASIIF